MKKQFNLSDKIYLYSVFDDEDCEIGKELAIPVEDVKTFIKKFEEYIDDIHNDIDKQYLKKFLYKLAGEELK